MGARLAGLGMILGPAAVAGLLLATASPPAATGAPISAGPAGHHRHGAAERRAAAERAILAGPHGFRLERTSLHAIERWGACTDPIPVWINPHGGPADFTSQIHEVLAEITRATGFGFAYQAASTPPDGEQSYGIELRWGAAAGAPTVPGAIAVADTRPYADPETGLMQHATVTFDPLVLAGPERAGERRTAYLHEIGHAMGLAHSPSPQAVMYATSTVAAYTPVDLAGLHAVGQAAGCA